MKSTSRGGPRPTRRRLVWMTAATLAISFVPGALVATGTFAGSGLTSDEVADEIARVQVKADDAAAALEIARFEAEGLAEDLAAAELEVAEAGAIFAEMESTLAAVAVRRYVNAGQTTPVILNSDPMTRVETEVLSLVATREGSVDLDEYADVRRDLDSKRARVDSLKQQNEALQAQIEQQQADLEAQLVALEELRKQLVDEEIKAAYEKRMAEIRAEQEAAAAKAAALAAQQQAAQATVPSARGSGSAPSTATSSSAGGTASTSGATVPAVAGTPAAAVPVAAPSSGSDSGSNDAPAPVATIAPPPPPVIVANFVCPVAGPVAFGDTWGAARSGGRHHEGVDMMAALGTPVVAVVSGTVIMKVSNLGGNSAWITGNDGNKYFYAHLNDWAGPSRPVSIGEVIGYVGHTGNTTANHLHFEIHPGGGAAVNPYFTVRQYC